MTDTETRPPAAHDPSKTAHILITQCLQNGFFLSEDCQLCLPKEHVLQILIGNQSGSEIVRGPTETKTRAARRVVPGFLTVNQQNNRRVIEPRHLRQGPLYRFLQAAITKKPRNSDLHVIHVRDWHALSEQYDHERRIYGKHCEANTWEAEPIDGFEDFLAPWKSTRNGQARAESIEGYHSKKYPKVHFHQVLSDSVFDFRRSDTIAPQTRNGDPRSFFEQVFAAITEHMEQVYVVVIGVYTDIKIKTLLMGLQSRFSISNLIVSDVLTAAPTLDRHLEGLDFADKVLNVEVIHSLNSALSVLDHEEVGPRESDEEIPRELFALSVDYTKMRTFFLDRQNVLGYQDQKIAEYLLLTSRRSSDVYEHVYSTNRWLTWFGRISLSALLLLVVLDALGVSEFDTAVWLAVGFGSMAQMLPALFSKPLERMQQNLNNLVRLRNYLESYSLTTAILRHHLTSTELLDNHNVESLRQQMTMIQDIAAEMRKNFLDIARGPDASTHAEAAAESSAETAEQTATTETDTR